MIALFTVSQSPLTPGVRNKPGELSKSLPLSEPQFLHLEGIGLAQWFSTLVTHWNHPRELLRNH